MSNTFLVLHKKEILKTNFEKVFHNIINLCIERDQEINSKLFFSIKKHSKLVRFPFGEESYLIFFLITPRN